MANFDMEHINELERVVSSLPEHENNKLLLDAMALIKNNLCRSGNPHRCHGLLWMCEECKRIFCRVESRGRDNLCDSCWSAKIEEEIRYVGEN